MRVGDRRLTVEVTEQPELLEMNDARELPDQRQLKRRDLLDEPFVGERGEELLGAGAGSFESGLDLDNRIHTRTLPDGHHFGQGRDA